MSTDPYTHSETRTLPSGKQFLRYKCRVCHSYWDESEKESHKSDCAVSFLRSEIETAKERARIAQEAFVTLDQGTKNLIRTLEDQLIELRTINKTATQTLATLERVVNSNNTVISDLRAELLAANEKVTAAEGERDAIRQTWTQCWRCGHTLKVMDMVATDDDGVLVCNVPMDCDRRQKHLAANEARILTDRAAEAEAIANALTQAEERAEKAEDENAKLSGQLLQIKTDNFWADCHASGERSANNCEMDGTHVCLVCEIADYKSSLAATTREAKAFAVFVWDTQYTYPPEIGVCPWRLPVNDLSRRAAEFLLSCGLLERHPANEDWYKWTVKKKEKSGGG